MPQMNPWKLISDQSYLMLRFCWHGTAHEKCEIERGKQDEMERNLELYHAGEEPDFPRLSIPNPTSNQTNVTAFILSLKTHHVWNRPLPQLPQAVKKWWPDAESSPIMIRILAQFLPKRNPIQNIWEQLPSHHFLSIPHPLRSWPQHPQSDFPVSHLIRLPRSSHLSNGKTSDSSNGSVIV